MDTREAGREKGGKSVSGDQLENGVLKVSLKLEFTPIWISVWGQELYFVCIEKNLNRKRKVIRTSFILSL